VKDGELYSADLANGFRPADILSLPFVRAQVRHYQREQRFPRQADFIAATFERVSDAPPLPWRDGMLLDLPTRERA